MPSWFSSSTEKEESSPSEQQQQQQYDPTEATPLSWWKTNMGSVPSSMSSLLGHPDLTLDGIHPGHILMATSIPFCYNAYHLYHASTDALVQTVLAAQTNGTVTMQDLQVRSATVDDGIRRSVGSVLAARALRISTVGSVGVCGISTALLLYASGTNTVEAFVEETTLWGHEFRRKVDGVFGTKDRFDKDHPEMVSMQKLSEDEQLEYISKHYLPNEEEEK